MTKEQFDNLQVGDKVCVYKTVCTVVRKDKVMYDVDFGEGDTVSFCWNEGTPVTQKTTTR